ncbi:MAG: hypothetical protein HW386_384 [Gammaproteobacteria bacterium]|nr:hypothetical protein [Gammaproteobacteria bacterium]
MQQLFEFAGNHLVLISLLVAISLMLIWNLYGSVMSGVKQLSPMEMTRLMNNDSAVVLDVRSNNDYNKGHVLGSLNIPDAEIPSKRKDLEKYKTQPVVVYCELGNVADRVVRTLRAYGLEQVYALKGGLGSWRQANLPLTKE